MNVIERHIELANLDREREQAMWAADTDVVRAVAKHASQTEEKS